MSFTPSRALLILVLIWNLSKASCQIGVFRVIDGDNIFYLQHAYTTSFADMQQKIIYAVFNRICFLE